MASITHMESNLKKALGPDYSIQCRFDKRKTGKNTESTTKSITIERVDGGMMFNDEDGRTWAPHTREFIEKFSSAIRGFHGTDYNVLQNGKVMEVISNFD